MAKQKLFAVTNAGPISGTFAVDVSQGPGLYELRGRKGSGKSTVLSTLALISGHRVDITVNDGELSGEVSGFGVVAPIGSRKRRRGEPEVNTLDTERFEFGDLIDPPGKTPAVRDAHAIKALVSLSGVRGEASAYYELFGGPEAFIAHVEPTDDPVLLATRVKNSLEEMARQEERIADAEAGHARGLEDQTTGIDTEIESDPAVLQDGLDKARDRWRSMQKDIASAEAADRKAAEARSAIAKAQSTYTGPTARELESEVVHAMGKVSDSDLAIVELERQLRNARQAAIMAREQLTFVQSRIAQARHIEELIAELRSIANARTTRPTQAELEQARVAGEAARQAYDAGLRARDALAAIAKARAHREKSVRHRKAGEQFRNTAARALDILTQSLSTRHIRVESIEGEPRLTVQHPRRGKTLYDKVNGLSDGERVKCAIEELLPRVEEPGLFAIPQRTYQDLQPSDRLELAKYGKEHGVYIFGALVTDDELSVSYRNG